ncbi:hypothetical protein ACFRDV_44095 [Streptomyces fagopyri]|uniref:hypothetical protein n=1 Tax=Streptomyces fagopyri TaxID=2662397 RepID=UPI0036A0D4E2
MITYWSAVVGRVAPAAGLTASVVGGAMLAALLVGDGAPWTTALTRSALAGLTCGVLFTLVVSIPDTATAVRTAAHFGRSLEPAAARLPVIRRVAAVTRGVTVFQLADSTLYALKGAQIPVVSEVLKLGHGPAVLICKSPYGPEIHVSMDFTVTDSRTLAVLRCRPTTSWKRLDGGASWAIAGTLERQVRAALLEH